MELTPNLLLRAYSAGIFPMAHAGEIYWYDPDPRAILPLAELHISRSLKRTLKRVQCMRPDGSVGYFDKTAVRKSQKERFLVTINQNFDGVISACADPKRPGAWIDEQIVAAYTHLHQLGFAHSTEVWQNGRLVGGVYGVAQRGLFAGESMFSHVSDASKIAIVYLGAHLKKRNFELFDVQFYTPHLGRLGAIEISRAAYKHRLAQAMRVNTQFYP